MRRYRAVPFPSLSDALRHAQRFYSDRHIAEELGALIGSVATPEDQEVIRQYARARKAARGFKPGSYTSNNHNLIPTDVLKAIRDGSGNTKCQNPTCGLVFKAKKRAKYCSPKCWRQGERKRNGRS